MKPLISYNPHIALGVRTTHTRQHCRTRHTCKGQGRIHRPISHEPEEAKDDSELCSLLHGQWCHIWTRTGFDDGFFLCTQKSGHGSRKAEFNCIPRPGYRPLRGAGILRSSCRS